MRKTSRIEEGMEPGRGPRRDPRPDPEAGASGVPAVTRVLQLQRTCGNHAVSRMLQVERGALPVRTLQRRVEPGFAVFNSQNLTTAAILETYYDEYVEPEAERVAALGYEADAIAAQGLRFRNSLIGLRRGTVAFASAQGELDSLVTIVNRAADDAETDKLAAYQGYLDVHPRQHAYQTQEDEWRRARKAREGILVWAGTAGTGHRRPIRGFRSAAEAETVINGLRDQLRQAGVADVQVAARGSAVRGSNRTRDRPYRPGTGDEEMSNAASDIDFFFSQMLETEVTRLDRENDRMWRQGNNVHPDKLDELLTIPAYEQFRVRLANLGIQAAAVRQVISTFPANTKNIIGRKSDVTLLRLNELGTFAADEYVLV